MLYPSHWAKGELGLADPNREPGEVIEISLPKFATAVDGTGAALVPWLQDFSLGYPYGEKEVREQIDATKALNVDSFLLWDPSCTYTEGALDAA
jgi:hypothetical protein